MELDLFGLIFIAVAAAVPTIIYAIWVRNSERCDRESWRSVLEALATGALFSFGLAYVIESVAITAMWGDGGILTRPFWFIDPQDPRVALIILACILAPLVEELTKAWGIMRFRNRFTELENGLIYGAAVGLGFAMVENALYGIDAFLISAEVFAATVVLRALTSTLLHASTSAIMGFGMAKRHLERKQGRGSAWWPYYLVAVGLHSLFNLFAISGSITSSETWAFIGLMGSLALVYFTFSRILGAIRQQDCRPFP